MIALFTKYTSIGILNTLIHWIIFGIVYWLTSSQLIGNLIGFMFAVTISFFLNAKWTFNSKTTLSRYIIFVSFMALLSGFYGFLGDLYHLKPAVTLIAFSGTSLILGFIFSKYIIFKGSKC